MATKNIVPRADGEGEVGTTTKRWGEVHADLIEDDGLTASKPVFTDASKQLTSSGTLGTAQGGTGATTLTDHGVLLGSGTSAVSVTDSGADGEVLVSNGASADPDWEYIPRANLIGNSGFGAWSQSDTNKGICTLNYDTGAKGAGSAPSVGDACVGANGATAILISYTTATGTWAGGDAAGVLTLGACTGGWTDNEVLTFGGVETAAVNGETVGICNDPCNNDGTGDWTDADSILSFDTDHYEIASDAADEKTYITSLSFTEGKIYKVEAQLKDGTATPTDVELVSLASSTVEYKSAPIDTTGSFTTYSCTFEATSSTDGVGINTPTSLGGNNIEMKYFICYEITPCCTAADTKAMDLWIKDSTCDIYREHSGSNTKDGSFYALKMVPITASDYVRFPGAQYDNEEWYMQLRGRTVTMGKWIKTSTASHAKLTITDSIGSTSSSYHTGGGTFEWLEVTRTINAAATSVAFYIYGDVAGTVDGNTIIYISQAMGAYGSSIGEGNYQSIAQEVIYLEQYLTDNLLSDRFGLNDLAWTNYDVEANFDGCIPKGSIAIQLIGVARDSGSAANDWFVGFRTDSTGPRVYLPGAGIGNDKWSRIPPWFQKCDSNGNIQYILEATGANTLDIDVIRCLAVQVN